MEELKYELDQSKDHCKALQEEIRHLQQQVHVLLYPDFRAQGTSFLHVHTCFGCC